MPDEVGRIRSWVRAGPAGRSRLVAESCYGRNGRLRIVLKAASEVDLGRWTDDERSGSHLRAEIGLGATPALPRGKTKTACIVASH